MTLDVTSAFVENTLSKNISPVRRFTIGSSDYSSNVLKWPKTSKTWDDPKPVSASIDLSNDELQMNFLRLDKTLLTSQCAVTLNYNEGWSIKNAQYLNKVFDIHPQVDYATDILISPDGLYLYILYYSAYKIFQYEFGVAGDIDTLSYTSKVLDFSADGTGTVYSMHLKPDGTKLYLMSQSAQNVYQYSLGTAWDISTGSSDSVSKSISSAPGLKYGMMFNPSGTKCYIVSTLNDLIWTFTLSSAWVLSTMTTSPTSFDVSAHVSNPVGLEYNGDGTSMYIADQTLKGIVRYEMTTPGDLSTASFHSKQALPILNAGFWGFRFTPDGSTFITIDAAGSIDVLHQFSANEEPILFAGTLDSVSYKNGKCSLRVIDKMKQLSDRLMGTDDSPIRYSNQLISDVAWWAVTSYGGYDTTTSTANTDIDWDSFNEWAGVMSGDNVRVSSDISGSKVTEILRKIARMSRTAVYIENDKLVFNRFSVVLDPDTSITDEMMKSSSLTIKDSDVINKQSVAAGYDINSRYHTITVSDVISSSVNSFGLREQLHEDSSIWYNDSNSALNLAQRVTFTDGEPIDRVSVDTPLALLTKTIGDTVGYVNLQQGISENYKIMKSSIDIDKGIVTVDIDRSQLVANFILDVTSLDGSEVLT